MSSIAERLRAQAQRLEDGYWDRIEAATLLRKCADEIESVRSDIDAQFRDMMDSRDVARAEQERHKGGTAAEWYEKKEEAYREAIELSQRADNSERKVAQLEAHIKRLENVAIMDGCRSAG